MRLELPLNFGWQYSTDAELYQNERAACEWLEVDLPHTNKELPYNYFDEKDYQFTSLYRKALPLEAKHKDRVIALHFEGVMAYCEVFINGVNAGEHKGGYTAFDIELDAVSHNLKFDGTDEVLVVVDSSERSDIPPFGGQIDFLTYGGIYREVQLVVTDKLSIKDVFVKPFDCLKQNKALDIDITLSNRELAQGEIAVGVELLDGDKVIASKQQSVRLSADAEEELNILLDDLADISLWSIDSPKLYQVQVTVGNDTVTTRTGFREAYFTTEGFFLNGNKLKLVGLNRHQSFPYVGYAMPRSAQCKDAEILKHDLGLNLVRTSHYPQSRHFLDRCDEIGLLVFEEIPGWQTIGDQEWQDVAVDNTREMIINDRNHPSIILWGVRINESRDNHDFYTRTNGLARQLDPTRQTGGVRNFEGSELLEDVYTMNDFILDSNQTSYPSQIGVHQSTPLRGQQSVTHLPHKVPYLVSEFNGHMFPTKKQDCEERVEEHTLRHLKVLDAGFCDDDISGVVGWCAWDYNTHKDFGAGDRICYHGVMDMFRTHKYASYAYQSQHKVEDKVVMEPITTWAFGDRCEGMGKCNFMVLTNCDRLDVKIGDESKSYYPSKTYFKGLPNPPIVVPAVGKEWGLNWQGISFIGYSKGEAVIEREFSERAVFDSLNVTPDSDTLRQADTWDTTRVVVKACDQVGNLVKYHNTIVNVQVEGAAELIGPSQIILHAGCSAFWLRTKQQTGEIKVTVSTPCGKQQQIKLNAE